MSGVPGVTAGRLELARRAAELRAGGLLVREVAVKLGVSRSYAQDLLNDPDGARGRARRDRCGGRCRDCGALTSGSNGRAKAPARCDPCSRAYQSANRKWSEANVVDAIRRFAAANGRPPTSKEWIKSDPVNGYPAATSVYRGGGDANPSSPFEQWSDAIVAAGYPRPRSGVRRRSGRGT